jgi:carbon-monoxide dehydrogenase iron sulfur subunit
MTGNGDPAGHDPHHQVQLVKELPPLDRRSFLKEGMTGLTALIAAVVVGDVLEAVTLPDGRQVALAKGVVLFDIQRCAGCRTCEAVCTTHNDQGSTSWSRARIILQKDYLKGRYEAKTCWQCAKPLCLFACPVTALQIDRTSGTRARIIDGRACIGCQQCVAACGSVFDPPRPRYDAARQVSVKCHLCLGEPRCVEFCPYGALRYERSEEGMETGYPLIRER